MSETEKAGPICEKCGGPVNGSGSKCAACKEDRGLVPSLCLGLSPSVMFAIAFVSSKRINEWFGPLFWISILLIAFAGVLAVRRVQGGGPRLAMFLLYSAGYFLLTTMVSFVVCAVKNPKFFGG